MPQKNGRLRQRELWDVLTMHSFFVANTRTPMFKQVAEGKVSKNWKDLASRLKSDDIKDMRQIIPI